MGRWSRRLARRFVGWLAVRPGAHWLEVGCGTGALTKAICDLAGPASVTACDPSRAYVEEARTTCPQTKVSFTVCGAGQLPSRGGGYEAVVSSLVLNFLPDPVEGLVGMRALGSADGIVAACVWDYGEGMQFLRIFWDEATARDPAASALDEGVRFPICRPDTLREAFVRAGLAEVQLSELQITTRFRDFDDYWSPFLSGPGPAPGYVATLDPEARSELARGVAARLPFRGDGSIALTARAWAARGSVSAAP